MTSYSEQWVLPENQTYLLNHALGLLPKTSEHTLKKYVLNPWMQQPENAWPLWLGVIEHYKNSLAQLFSSVPSQFCPQSNVSSGLTKILQSLHLPDRKQTILLCEDDFPTVGFVAKYCENFSLKFIPKEQPTQNLDVWAKFLTKDIDIALITHAQSTTGRLTPVEDITKLTHHQGIFSIVDVAQSAGVIPISFVNWHADAVIGSCLKWLCGGPGAGFLWLALKRIENLRPKDVGWFSHTDPFEMDIHHFEYAKDAQRFLGGTPSIAPFALAHNSIQELLGIGIHAIRAHNAQARAALSSWFTPSDIVSPRGAAHQNATLIVKATEQNKERLRSRHTAFDEREGNIRLSPHIYNDIR